MLQKLMSYTHSVRLRFIAFCLMVVVAAVIVLVPTFWHRRRIEDETKKLWQSLRLFQQVDDRNVSSEMAADSLTGSDRRVRILCWIMTDPPDLDLRVIHIKNTWASRCDVTLYFSSQENKTFPTIGLDVPPGRNNIAVKSRESWKYVYHHHLEDADYFVKADPDSYLLLGNMRRYLSHCDPHKPEAFGHWLKLGKVTYFSGAAYVISREALRRLATVGYTKYSHFIKDGQAEDLKNGMVLHEVGTRFVDTKDLEKRQTFLPLSPNKHLFPRGVYIPEWYKKYREYDFTAGEECCSKHPVAFHYVSSADMYLVDYLLKVGGYPLADEVQDYGTPDTDELIFLGSTASMEHDEIHSSSTEEP